MKKALFVVTAIFVLSVFVGTASAYKLLDFSHKWENGMPAWAGKWTGLEMWGGCKSQMECYDKVGPGFYGHDVKFTEHTGTHMDSPSHNAYGFWRIDQIPIDKFVGKAVIMDMRPWVKDQDGYEVSLANIKAWEKKTGCDLMRDAARSMVFMWTGWDKFWYDYIEGKNDRFVGAKFTGITEDAAKYLADCRIKGFGFDTLSIDTYKRVVAGKTLAHNALFGNLIWVIENVKYDPSVADKWVYAVTAPMKIFQGSGAPCRVFILDDTNAKGLGASLSSMIALEKKIAAAPMYDLANDVRNGMHIWQGVFGGNLVGVGDLNNFKGIYPWIAYYDGGFFGNQIFCNEHTGTHTDSPSHRREGAQWTLDKVPMQHWAAPCLVVNASRYGPEEGDWIFDMNMFQDWMMKHPNLTVKKGDIVCFSQDMVHKWALHNNGFHRDWVTYKFPGIGADVAKYVADKGIVGALTDVTSIDAAKVAIYGKGNDVENNPTHINLLGKGIYVTENVGGDLQQAANSKGFAFVMPCVQAKDGSGFHSRIWYFEGLNIPIE